MRKEVITCDRCKHKWDLVKGINEPHITKGRELCSICYIHKYLQLNKWFDKEMEKWLDGKENELPSKGV